MRITKIHFFFTAPNNLHWNKIGMEAEIMEGDDVRQCLYSLKNQVEAFFYESSKADEKKEIAIKVQEKINPKSQEETIIDNIGKCTTIEGAGGLQSYELLAKNNAAIKVMYDLKLKQLQK